MKHLRFNHIRMIAVASVLVLLSILLTGCETTVDSRTYEVVSVNQYLRTHTNGYGGIEDQEICYSFIYLDESGKPTPDEVSAYHIDIGETDSYQVSGATYTLVLTRETMDRLSGKVGGRQ